MEINDNTEPILLNYGSSKINQLDFLNNVANNVESYLASQPWSSKRKELFRKAYDNIMSLNVTGADNSSGSWKVTYEGDLIPFDTLSRKEREMYGEAAYFIQQQMLALTPVNLQDEKKDKLLFDNKYFTSQLNHRIGLDVFGGRDWDNQTNWNVLDSIGNNGLRGTSVRAGKLANVLENYANSLKEEDLNFEGTSFDNLNDFKTRALNVAANLRNGTWTPDMLNELGLDPNIYLSDGRNDIVSYQGKQMTREDYNNYITEQNRLQEQLKLQLQQDLAKQKLQLKIQLLLAINLSIQSSPFKTMTVYSPIHVASGWNINQLANKYGKDLLLLIQDLNALSTKSKLTPDELSLLIGAYRNAPKVGISKEEFDVLKRSKTFQNRAIGDFQRIKGVDNIIYDKKFNRFIFARNTPQSLTNWLEGKSDKEIEEAYLKSKIPGLTNAESKELWALGLDIASIIDPEAISGSIMSTTAAGLRHSAKNDAGHKWTLSDYLGLGLDYLTGVLGGVQVVGDAMLTAKAMNTARKAIPIFQKLARVGAWADIVQSTPGVAEATRKLINGEELNVQDWRAIGTAIRGLVSHGRMNRLNRLEGAVIKHRGLLTNKPETKWREFTQKTGFTRVKSAKLTEVPTIKLKDSDGNIQEIKVRPETKAELESKFKGKTDAEKIEIAKTNSKLKEDIELHNQSSAKKIDASKIELQPESSVRNIKGLRRFVGTNKGIFGTKTEVPTRGTDDFDTWVKNRDFWDKYEIFTGTGRTSDLQRIDKRLNLGLSTTSVKNSETSKAKSSSSTNKTNKEENFNLSDKMSEQRRAKYNKAVDKRLEKLDKGEYSNNPLKSGDIDFVGHRLQVVELSDGTFNLIHKGNILGNFQKHELKKLQETIRNIINERTQRINSSTNVKTIGTKELGKILLEFKRKGWLKQGGTIDKQKIQRYKEFMKK